MPYDPSKPANGTPNSSAEMRGQLQSLKALIDAGIPGPPGPPLAGIVIDSTTTGDPGTGAEVAVTFDGDNAHLSFIIPRGDIGPTGEVTMSTLDGAIATSAQNPSGIDILDISISDPPTQSELQGVINRLNELITALKRTV